MQTSVHLGCLNSFIVNRLWCAASCRHPLLRHLGCHLGISYRCLLGQQSFCPAPKGVMFLSRARLQARIESCIYVSSSLSSSWGTPAPTRPNPRRPPPLWLLFSPDKVKSLFFLQDFATSSQPESFALVSWNQGLEFWIADWFWIERVE